MSKFITGVPGTGKTAQVVSELNDQLQAHLKSQSDPAYTGIFRLYQHGIRDFKLPHIQVFCRDHLCLACKDVKKDESTLYADEWHLWAVAGDKIVIDECQRIWGPRNVNSKKPDSVAMFETHRHFGVEFWLMTQNPKLVDSAVRCQMQQHIHTTAGSMGRKLYEWSEVNDALNLTTAVERDYKLDKSIFDLYKSAEEHVIPVRKKPMSFYVTIGAIALAVVAGGFVSYRIYQRVHPAPLAVVDQQPVASGQVMPTSVANTIPVDAFPDFNPTIAGVPESAPAYAPVLKVVSAPVLMGCIKTKEKCACYTNQATPYPASKQYCEEYMKGGRFNPYINYQHKGNSQQIAENSETMPKQKVNKNNLDTVSQVVEN